MTATDRVVFPEFLLPMIEKPGGGSSRGRLTLLKQLAVSPVSTTTGSSEPANLPLSSLLAVSASVSGRRARTGYTAHRG